MHPVLKVALLCLPAVTASAENKRELEPDAPASARGEMVGVHPRRQGLSVDLHGEVDVLGSGPMLPTAITPVVGIRYTQERLGGLLGILVQQSPGLRAEARLHLSTQGCMRTYAGLGATAFFHEPTAQGTSTFLGGVGGRGVLGVDVQWTSRLYVFADLAYERYLPRGDLYRDHSVLLSVGVGLFP